ncbi:PEBP-like protein [Crepidotus variabilis]|uniref:PEBP-like protein n=1 Tax=Crepidotus variabilis TaxID=179855 RepID=A0A9P6JLC4_9AGAR|nr:PEBP-like protein [Crepidotus variabilis]
MADPISKITSSLKADGIIPSVIPADYTFTPSVLFSVVWPSNGSEVVLGSKIPREDTIEEPKIKIQPLLAPEAINAGGETLSKSKSDGAVSYTLVLTDPDAPSKADPKYGQWRHWVLTGVQLPAANAAETEGVFALKPKAASTTYIPPTPPPGSGLHRYVFLLFQEPAGGFTVPQGSVETDSEFNARRNWDAIKFADKHSLKLVGATYFLTEVKEA